jgi:hypothetical protein
MTAGYRGLAFVLSHVTSGIFAIAAASAGILLTALLAGFAVRAIQNATTDMPASDQPGCHCSGSTIA